MVPPNDAATPPAAATTPHTEPRHAPIATAASPSTCSPSATQRRAPPAVRLRMIDATGSRGSPESVVDIDNGDTRRAGVEHREQGRQAAERGAVPHARGHGDDRHLHETPDHARQGALHTRDPHDDRSAAPHPRPHQHAATSPPPPPPAPLPP